MDVEPQYRDWAIETVGELRRAFAPPIGSVR